MRPRATPVRVGVGQPKKSYGVSSAALEKAWSRESLIRLTLTVVFYSYVADEKRGSATPACRQPKMVASAIHRAEAHYSNSMKIGLCTLTTYPTYMYSVNTVLQFELKIDTVDSLNSCLLNYCNDIVTVMQKLQCH